jgi:hypothetical protein
MQYKGENETLLEVAEAATELREVQKILLVLPLYLSLYF